MSAASFGARRTTAATQSLQRAHPGMNRNRTWAVAALCQVNRMAKGLVMQNNVAEPQDPPDRPWRASFPTPRTFCVCTHAPRQIYFYACYRNRRFQLFIFSIPGVFFGSAVEWLRACVRLGTPHAAGTRKWGAPESTPNPTTPVNFYSNGWGGSRPLNI